MKNRCDDCQHRKNEQKCYADNRWWLIFQKNQDNNCMLYKPKKKFFAALLKNKSDEIIENKKGDMVKHSFCAKFEDIGIIKDCLGCGCLIVLADSYCKRCQSEMVIKKHWWEFWR